MDQWLQSFEESCLAQWTQSSAYPAIITLHSIGLAISVGLLTVINLRVLGFVEALPLPALRRYMPVVWFGFALNAATGTMLFSIDAEKYFYSHVFRLKLCCIAIGLCLAWAMQWRALRNDAVNRSAKGFAVLSLLVWGIAIVSGRLLASQ